jgi:uncharacterized membrane protein
MTEAVARRRSPERLEAFSDGVFSIAITLLVLNIRIPAGADLASSDALLAALGGSWPSYLGYLVSFISIGIIWANHHNLFRLVGGVDHGLLLANLFLLLCVGLVPFTTALLASTITGPGQQIGVLVYAGLFVAIAIGFNVLWSRARRVLAADADPGSVEAINRSYRLGVPGYVAAFVAAIFSPALGLAIIIALVILYVLPRSSGA